MMTLLTQDWRLPPGRRASAAALSLPTNAASAGDDSLLRPGGRTVISRRRFITGSVIALTPLGAPASAQEYKAQQAAKRMHRIGFLAVGDASSSSPYRSAFTDGMRQLGYQEAKDYSIEARYAEGKLDRLRTLAAELVELKVDVIVLGSVPAALAAQDTTNNIPIVVAAAGDVVGNGLVASLERPGRNITGLDEVVPGLAGERLRLLA